MRTVLRRGRRETGSAPSRRGKGRPGRPHPTPHTTYTAYTIYTAYTVYTIYTAYTVYNAYTPRHPHLRLRLAHRTCPSTRLSLVSTPRA